MTNVLSDSPYFVDGALLAQPRVLLPPLLPGVAVFSVLCPGRSPAELFASQSLLNLGCHKGLLLPKCGFAFAFFQYWRVCVAEFFRPAQVPLFVTVMIGPKFDAPCKPDVTMPQVTVRDTK